MINCSYMKILAYEWGLVGEEGVKKAFSGIPDVEVISYFKKTKDFHADSEVGSEIITLIHKEKIRAVFSFDYIPILSMICEINEIPYLSWIWDCPQPTAYSKTITNDTNYIFSFDRIQAERLTGLGGRHVFYLPLSADPLMRESAEEKQDENRFRSDISFVGNLYTDERNRVRNAAFSEYTKGFLEGLVSAQEKVYGYNFIYESLPENIVREITDVCGLKLNDEMYRYDQRALAADAVGMEVSARERVDILGMLAAKQEVHLYSNTKVLPEELKIPGLVSRPPVSYKEEMPKVFYQSRINLNITSKTIEHGVPLRVFDILSCGGFCLTNYQTGIAELFEDGADLVMYSSLEDAAEKAEYYLSHEKERKEIAQNGFRKLKTEHTTDIRVRDILTLSGLIRS